MRAPLFFQTRDTGWFGAVGTSGYLFTRSPAPPQQPVSLVPERKGEVTTEGGLNVTRHPKEIQKAVRRLQRNGMEVSLFIDPHLGQIEGAAASGATLIEINTARYAEAVPKGLSETNPGFQKELGKIAKAAEFAESLGLRVLAGHGLTYRNVGPVSGIPQIIELNIGHNIIARAALVGMDRAVREMLEAMNGPGPDHI